VRNTIIRFCTLFFVFVGFAVSVLKAQTIPVGMPFFEDALRRGQLMGKLDSNVSFQVRPVDPIRAMRLSSTFGKDSMLFPLDSLQYSSWANESFLKGKIRVVTLPLYFHTQYNQHHPYGWSDGLRIPNKGIQQYVSGGLYVKAGRLEIQYRPEFLYAQNQDFQNPPYRAIDIDNPDRFGTKPIYMSAPGQSFAKLHFGPMAVGYSTENIFWGPGLKNSIVMTNNAPGFGHFTIHTNRPIKTRYGTLEGQFLGAQLENSGFHPYPVSSSNWPPIAGDILPDTTKKSKYHSFVNGVVLSFQPKWTPGLFLGVTRVVQARGVPKKLNDYLKIGYLGLRGENTGQGPDANGFNRNQIISFFGRYLFQQSHAEVYFEMGREDAWFDAEDLITNPTHTTVWMAGMRKLYVLPGKDRWLQVFGEYAKIQAPVSNYSRAFGYSFYTHSPNVEGWTHRGQVLGAGIGPGSNMNTAGITYGKGFNTYGLHLERVVYNEDMLYTRINYLRLNPNVNPLFIDDSKHYVDWGFLLSHHTTYGKIHVGYNLHIMRTYNFQWNYDPYGAAGPFRFPGINLWSVNADVSLVYRF